MTIPTDSKTPRAIPVKLPSAATPAQETDMPPKRHPPRHVPILDADFDDLAPGYSESDSWYEP